MKEYTSIKFCKDELSMDREKTVNFSNYMRELSAFDLIENPVKIGCPGMVVEIDETVYARRKYNQAVNFPNNVFFFIYRNLPRVEEMLLACSTFSQSRNFYKVASQPILFQELQY